MATTATPLTPTTEVLCFDVPELDCSQTMLQTATRCAGEHGIPCRTLDVWNEPEAVVAHRVLGGPTIIVFVDGVEVGRLVGPCRARRIERLFSDLLPAPAPQLELAS